MTKRLTGDGPNLGGFCMCGCGEKTPLARHSNSKLGVVIGKPVSFVQGHQVKKMQKLNTRHGLSHTPEWKAYWSARERCTNPKHAQYSNYGERGIKFLFDSFEAFLAEAGMRPSSKHSIDRLNNDSNYETGNIAWRTRSEQQRNKRNSLTVRDVDLISLYESGQSTVQIANHFGVKFSSVANRLHRAGIRLRPLGTNQFSSITVGKKTLVSVSKKSKTRRVA
jgi:hypothetical protein